MDRKKLARWETLLPICLALASGCESRGTSGRADRESVARADRNGKPRQPSLAGSVPSIQPTEFQPQAARRPTTICFPLDRFERTAKWPGLACRNSGRSDFGMAWGGLPFARRRVPAEVTPLPSEPIGDDASSARQPSAGSRRQSRRVAEPRSTAIAAARAASLGGCEAAFGRDGGDCPIGRQARPAGLSPGGTWSGLFGPAEVFCSIVARGPVARRLSSKRKSTRVRSSRAARLWSKLGIFGPVGLPMATDMARIVAAHRTADARTSCRSIRCLRSRRSSAISAMPKSNLRWRPAASRSVRWPCMGWERQPPRCAVRSMRRI